MTADHQATPEQPRALGAERLREIDRKIGLSEPESLYEQEWVEIADELLGEVRHLKADAERQRERAEAAEEALADTREDLEAKKLTIARAIAHLGAMHMHSNPRLREQELKLAEQAIEADCDDTIHALIVNAQHLEWVAELIARGESTESVRQTAEICLERFRNGVVGLAAARQQPADDEDGR